MGKYSLGALGLILPLAVLALFFSGTAWTQEETDSTVETAKAVLEKHKDAVVQITLVLKSKTIWGGRQSGASEQKIEVNGTVIDKSGLTIISNFHTDPGSGDSFDFGEDGPSIRQETSVTDVRIVTADGREYPAKLVLRDSDLDLAFIRPDQQDLDMPHVTLKEYPNPKILDEIISLTRLDRFANREPGIYIGRIMSVIKKPRVRYITQTNLEAGCPVFDASGNLLGLALMRIGGTTRWSSYSFLNTMPAVLPCSDILEVMKQLPPRSEDKK